MDKFKQIMEQIVLLKPDFATEEIELKEAFNRVLQEDVLADTNMPPFDKSAMDGYACRLVDIENEMEVLETINAGMMPTREIKKNQCSKIMTGAALPKGADCVFMVEHSQQVEKNKVKCTNPNTNKNICYLGEDYKKNDILINKGTIINVSQMAVLAGAGYHKVIVSKRPRIALINTGSELVEPHEKPKSGQIRNSNGSQLISQLIRMNLEVTNYGIIEDDYAKHVEVMSRAIERNDYIFFTGGASVGEFDLVPKILNDLDFEVYWDRTGIKPGNPMTFSRKGNKYCFGLSGNPVSSLMQFELIAKPVIYKLLGANYTPFRIQTFINFDYKRKKDDRLGIVPVVVNKEGMVDKIDFHGSAHINALVYANALLEVPLGVNKINKGEKVYVRPL